MAETKEVSPSELYLALVKRDALIVKEMAEVFRQAEDWQHRALFAEGGPWPSQSAFCNGKMDVALKVICRHLNTENQELVKKMIREGTL